MIEHSAEITKGIEFRPAWDRRSTDTSKDYGIHCAELVFYVKGLKGAVTFVIYTGWYLPKNQQGSLPAAMGADISYHTRSKQYDGQLARENCSYLDGATCYSDGSSLSADELFDKFVAEGEDVVWSTLMEWYNGIEE
jgi:hypothetical protein